MMQGKKCKLLTDSNIAVAEGLVIETNVKNPMIHGKPLGDMNYRVAVEVSIVGETPLPILVNDKMTTVFSALGSQVAWPKHLVMLGDGPVR